MGKKDFGKRETKKPKKDTKKTEITSIAKPQPMAVEVFKKARKPKEQEQAKLPSLRVFMTTCPGARTARVLWRLHNPSTPGSIRK